MITLAVLRIVYLLICLWTIWRVALAFFDYTGKDLQKVALNIVIIFLVHVGYWTVRDSFITVLQLLQQFNSVWRQV